MLYYVWFMIYLFNCVYNFNNCLNFIIFSNMFNIVSRYIVARYIKNCQAFLLDIYSWSAITKLQKQVVKMYKIQLIPLLHIIYHGAVFTFPISQSFLQTWGCVLLKRQLKNPNITPFITPSHPTSSIQNCTKITHNLIQTPKSTSILTSITPIFS